MPLDQIVRHNVCASSFFLIMVYSERQLNKLLENITFVYFPCFKCIWQKTELSVKMFDSEPCRSLAMTPTEMHSLSPALKKLSSKFIIDQPVMWSLIIHYAVHPPVTLHLQLQYKLQLCYSTIQISDILNRLFSIWNICTNSHHDPSTVQAMLDHTCTFLLPHLLLFLFFLKRFSIDRRLVMDDLSNKKVWCESFITSIYLYFQVNCKLNLDLFPLLNCDVPKLLVYVTVLMYSFVVYWAQSIN